MPVVNPLNQTVSVLSVKAVDMAKFKEFAKENPNTT